MEQENDIIDDDPYGDLYYRCIKFKDGDVVVAGIPRDDLDYTGLRFIEIYTPLQLIETTAEEDGDVYQAFQMKRWMPLSNQDYFEIATDTIQCIFEIKPKYEEGYFNMLDRFYYQDLKEIIAEEKNLTDEEREDIADQIGGEPMYDQNDDDLMPDEMPTSKYLH